MKKNTFIAHPIWLGILFILSSLLHVSCEGCRPESLERDRDPEIAKITMDSQDITDSINGAPIVGIVGKITEKRIPETSQLCVLVIKEGTSEVKAIETFRTKTKKQELGNGNKGVSCLLLAADGKDKSQGAVYYGKDILGPEQGRVEASVFVDLPAGKYTTFLLLHNANHGTFFSAGKSLEIPPYVAYSSTLDPAISMVDAQPERDKTAPDTLLITTNAAARNSTGKEKGWFLFIDKKDTVVDAKTVIADLLKSGNDIPTNAEFTSLANGKAFVHPFSNPVVDTNNQLLNAPAKKIFQRGATYKVYGCLFYIDKDGKKQYVVSEAAVDMLIPKPVVELDIKEVKITELIKCLDNPNLVPGTDELSIDYVAEITKEEGTTNPQIGLLFAKAQVASDKAGSHKIEDLLTKAVVDGYYQDGGELVYLIGVNTKRLQDIITTPSVPLELGVIYHVYFFLQDGGGEIFLSKNNVPLTVPSVELKVIKFKTGKGGDKATIDQQHEVENPIYSEGLGNKISVGYMIFQQGMAVDKLFLQQILRNTNGKDTDSKKNTYQANLGDAVHNFMDINVILSDKLTSTCEGIYKDTHVGKSFDVYLVASCENAVFWKTAPITEKFIWYELYKVTTTQGDIKGWKNSASGFDGKKYQFSYRKMGNQYMDATIYEIDLKGSKIFVELNNKPGHPDNNEDLIKKLIGYVIEGAEVDAGGIDNFMGHMKKLL